MLLFCHEPKLAQFRDVEESEKEFFLEQKDS